MTKIAETIALGFFNKMVGAIFGFLKYALILSIVLIVYDEINRSITICGKRESQKNRFYMSPSRILLLQFFQI